MAGVKGKSGRKSDAHIRKYGTEKVGTTKAGQMRRVAENMMAARTAIEPALLIRKLNGIALTSLDLAQSGEKATTAQIAALRLASSIYQGLLNKVVSDVRALEVVDSAQSDALNGVLLMPQLEGGPLTNDHQPDSVSASNAVQNKSDAPVDAGSGEE